MDYEKLAELLFPQIDKTPEDYYAMYPQRELPEGAMAVSYTHLETRRLVWPRLAKMHSIPTLTLPSQQLKQRRIKMRERRLSLIHILKDQIRIADAANTAKWEKSK